MTPHPCASCVYLFPVSDDEADCRRFPPQVILVQADIHSQFPLAYARCGEFTAEGVERSGAGHLSVRMPQGTPFGITALSGPPILETP